MRLPTGFSRLEAVWQRVQTPERAKPALSAALMPRRGAPKGPSRFIPPCR